MNRYVDHFMETYIDLILPWLMSAGLRILLILVMTAILLKVVSGLSNRLFTMLLKNHDNEFRKRALTLRSIIRYTLGITTLIIALVMVLDVLEIDVGPILAAAGVVGIAIGFGAQTLVQDIISGIFIFVEDQIRVGDVVEIAGKSGLVEKITLRMVVLRDASGNVHYLRNGHIDTITNMTKDYSQYVFDIGVSYREDVDQVMAVIRAVDSELRADPAFASDILEPMEIFGLDRFEESAVIIQARTKTTPINQWRVAREFNRRLKMAFDRHGIEMPFPHLTIYPGTDRTGQAPALHVRVEGSSADNPQNS